MRFKKATLVFCFMLMIVYMSMAQATMADIFNNDKPITWLGLDFTGAKFIGGIDGYGSASDLKSTIESWNNSIENNKNMFNISAAIHKVRVDYKIDIAKSHNELLDVTAILQSKPGGYFHLREEDIDTIIKGYDFKDLKGLGLIFNVEGFNKTVSQAAVWITFIDIATKEIILTERMVMAPWGNNALMTYWSNAIMDIIKEIKKKQYEMWRRKFGA